MIRELYLGLTCHAPLAKPPFGTLTDFLIPQFVELVETNPDVTSTFAHYPRPYDSSTISTGWFLSLSKGRKGREISVFVISRKEKGPCRQSGSSEPIPVLHS